MVKATSDIQDYKFMSFTDVEDEADSVKLFEFKPLLSAAQTVEKSEFQKVIRVEREQAKNSNFKVNPITEKYRGLRDQETREYEDRVEEEVKKRVEQIQEEAFKAGFEEGVKQGREEIFDQMRNSVDQKLEDVSQMVTNVLKTYEEIFINQKVEMYQLIKNLTKWIVLRELNEDGKYIERLLERLLLEIQARNNLLIQVNANDFTAMPEVLEHVQKKLGELKNVRIEIDHSVHPQGLIVESENGIINATMEEQFKSLDKLFEEVMSIKK
jgi:flagellar assembly protein FliH